MRHAGALPADHRAPTAGRRPAHTMDPDPVIPPAQATTRRILPLAPVILLRHPHPGELRQDAWSGEPVEIVGVTDQYRRTRRRTQHPGLRDPPPHQRIDQRGLARTGRSADHCEQRGLRRAQPGNHIVVELGEQLGPVAPGAGSAPEWQWKACGVDAVTQNGQCVDQPGSYVQGRHMCRMPNFVGFLKRITPRARRKNPHRSG
ncbi:hypothetical protein Sliba_50920 [Streptomyces nigrescens]|uniref:Uncharacterized protein n=1 Tax=Streptomyces nigrescens TaxID=1920 RepID=A0A640TM95_STRNI|nr:hypothetical protein Sliba_50920 [Streptomyces libani subsp. libani]GGV94893.1 hypothetical protein GCM10010500_33860 [Streptomyces libani subsp. libani]